MVYALRHLITPTKAIFFSSNTTVFPSAFQAVINLKFFRWDFLHHHFSVILFPHFPARFSKFLRYIAVQPMFGISFTENPFPCRRALSIGTARTVMCFSLPKPRAHHCLSSFLPIGVVIIRTCTVFKRFRQNRMPTLGKKKKKVRYTSGKNALTISSP